MVDLFKVAEAMNTMCADDDRLECIFSLRSGDQVKVGFVCNVTRDMSAACTKTTLLKTLLATNRDASEMLISDAQWCLNSIKESLSESKVLLND